MADLSLSLALGAEGFKNSDFTVGTSSPGAGDIELRINDTSNGQKVRRIDVLKALKAFERALESNNQITNALE